MSELQGPQPGEFLLYETEDGRNRTLGLDMLMAIDVPVPPLAVQQTFDRLQAEVAALKARHTAIRQANAALTPATLERVFAGNP